MSNVRHFMHFEQTGKAVKELIENNKDQKYLLLFKGSQNTIFLEESVKYILKHIADQRRLTRQGQWREEKKRTKR